MAIPMNTEETLEECKRHIDECAALLARTSVPEYREAIIAMGKAWMKIEEKAKEAGGERHRIRNFDPIAYLSHMRKIEFLPCSPTRGTKVPAGPDWLHE